MNSIFYGHGGVNQRPEDLPHSVFREPLQVSTLFFDCRAPVFWPRTLGLSSYSKPAFHATPQKPPESA